MLRTALINTRKLNKALQDMLHNIGQVFREAFGSGVLRRTFAGASGRVCGRNCQEKVSYLKDLRQFLYLQDGHQRMSPGYAGK